MIPFFKLFKTFLWLQGRYLTNLEVRTQTSVIIFHLSVAKFATWHAIGAIQSITFHILKHDFVQIYDRQSNISILHWFSHFWSNLQMPQTSCNNWTVAFFHNLEDRDLLLISTFSKSDYFKDSINKMFFRQLIPCT